MEFKFKLVAANTVEAFEKGVQDGLNNGYLFQGDMVVTPSPEGPQYTVMMVQSSEVVKS